MNRTKVFIVEDHKIVQEGIRLLLSGQEGIDITGVAGHGEQMFEILKEKQPDVLLLDEHLPGMNGTELLPVLRKKYPDIKVIFLTMSMEDETLSKAIKGGAKGFLYKGIDGDELLLAIRKVSQGKEYYSSDVSKIMVTSFTRKVKRTASMNIRSDNMLSRRENEILAYVREGYSNCEIAVQFGLSVRTIEGHKDKMRRKLNLKKGTDLLIYALKNK